jgi:hypothetical protein
MPRAEFKLKGYLKNISVGEHVKYAEIFFNDTWKTEARAAATSPVKTHKSIGPFTGKELNEAFYQSLQRLTDLDCRFDLEAWMGHLPQIGHRPD